jgi:hypothetical protein
MIKSSLQCWHCQAVKRILISELPRFAFEVAKMAQDVGWIGAIDMAHHRSLVFCSKECDAAARTKTGSYRRYPLRKKDGK